MLRHLLIGARRAISTSSGAAQAPTAPPIPPAPLIPSIKVTNDAWAKIAEICKRQNADSFVFATKSGGCSGYNYSLQLIEPSKYQETYDELSNGGKINLTMLAPSQSQQPQLHVIIDPLSEMSLMGTTIDYKSEDYGKGIYENKFVFIPDKDLAHTCGCGISFTPKSN